MQTNQSTYECPICYGINSVSKLHCSTCGAIPPRYSVTGKAIGDNGFNIVIAFGCDRVERHRTIKRELKTVPADYYADCE